MIDRSKLSEGTISSEEGHSLTTYLRRFFLSRITIICLILAALSAITLAAFIPQRFSTAPEKMAKWETAHPARAQWTALLGMQHIYTSPFFALILAGVVISLSISTWSQSKRAWRLTFTSRTPDDGTDRFDTSASREAVANLLRTNGYFRLKTANESVLMVRHPWGYWGLALFHLGMLAAIASSLLIALTQQRGTMQISQGDLQTPDSPMIGAEQGLLVGPLRLPASVRLDELTYSFRPNSYGIRSVASTLSFIPETGNMETKKVEVNSILRYHGMSYYQGLEFGHAFLLEITCPDGHIEKTQLQLQHPETPDKPSYQTLKEMLGQEYVLRVKYVINEEMKSFDRVEPLLTLRVDLQEQEIGRLPLKSGGEGTIGLFKFKLHGVVPWSRLIVVNITGLPGVFFGFTIICLGGLLHYFTHPREITILDANKGNCTVTWRGTRFAGLYRKEYEQLKKSLEEISPKGCKL